MTHGHLALPSCLIITDHPSIRTWMSDRLKEQFFLIFGRTVHKILETVQSTSLDFILLDASFEECEALELARQMRQFNPIIPILLLTGRLKKSYREEALLAGVTDFLSNQLDAEELETRIATGLKAASTRGKTTDTAFLIKTIAQNPSLAFLNSKLLLTEETMQMLARCKRKHEPITLLLLSLDQHVELEERDEVEADLLLTKLFQRLQPLLRSYDLFIPSDHGRFVVLLPNTTLEQANYLANDLRKTVASSPFLFKEAELPLTISLAISSLEGSEEQYRQLVTNAAHALKQAQTLNNLIIFPDKDSL